MDFDIPCSLDFMRNKSKQALKNMVNKLGQRQSQTPFSSAFCVQKEFRSKKVLGLKSFNSKKKLGPKNFGSKYFHSGKILGPKKI